MSAAHFVPYTGNYFASTGCIGSVCIDGTPSQQASLSQTLATIPGDTYDLSFEFDTAGFGAPNELAVVWDGTTVLDLGPGGTLGPVTSYTDYSVSGLVATSSATTLTFLGRQDPGHDALGFVDVEQVSSVVPEPSYLLLSAAFFLLFGLRQFGRRSLDSR